MPGGISKPCWYRRNEADVKAEKYRMSAVRAISLLLILSFLFTACNTDTSDPADVLPDTESVESAGSGLVVCENGSTDFTVIRGELADDCTISAASALRTRLSALFHTEFGIGTDWVSGGASVPTDTCEILIGETNRSESIAMKEDLNFKGYLIRVTENRIAVMGSNKALLTEALQYFCEEILMNTEYSKDGKTVLPAGLEIRHETSLRFGFSLSEALENGGQVLGSIEEVFNYPCQDGFTAAQGAAADGTHLYIVMGKSENGREFGRIVKVDMTTWKVEKESETLPLDHGNDMAYDSARNRLVVTNMYDNIITILDPETLEITETRRLNFGTYAAAYRDSKKRFVFAGYGAAEGLVVTDEEFQILSTLPLASSPGYVGQGMDADASYIYVPLSPDFGSDDNIIQVYDWNGVHYGNISIPSTWEIETLFHVGDQFYAQFNHSGATICKLDFYEKFQ